MSGHKSGLYHCCAYGSGPITLPLSVPCLTDLVTGAINMTYVHIL